MGYRFRDSIPLERKLIGDFLSCEGPHLYAVISLEEALSFHNIIERLESLSQTKHDVLRDAVQIKEFKLVGWRFGRSIKRAD